MKFLSDEMHSLCHVMSSDEDGDVIMDLYAGYSKRHELMVCADYHFYSHPEYNCSTALTVDTQDAFRMAKRHDVEYSNLALFISDCMAEWREIINASPNQVRDCFKEITECLLDERCKFRITRTKGRGGYICC